MDRLGYDSSNLNDIPDGAAVAFIYTDQVPDDQHLAELEQRWPVVVLIDRGLGDPTGNASVIDVENGARTPADAPTWWDKQHAAGVEFLTVYVNRSNMAAVDSAMGHRPYYRWISTLDGTMLVPEFPDAIVQFEGASAAGGPGTGSHADASIIRNDHWHPQPTAGDGWVAAAAAAAESLTRTLLDHK